MKTSIIKRTIFAGMLLAFTLSACLKEPEINTYIEDYLDSLAVLDTIPIDLDVPCTTPPNMIFYGAYDHEFTIITCNNTATSGFKVTGSNPDDHVTIILTFKNRPAAGKYITDSYSTYPPSSDSEVYVQYNTNSDDFTSVKGDTLYLERLSGGLSLFSFCNLQMDAGWGGYYANGSVKYNLSACD